MDRSREDGDLDDLRQKTARAHEKLLCLLLDVAPRVKSQDLRSERDPLTQTSQPAIRDWTENRLADFNLWITGINFLSRPEVSSSLGPVKSVIASLLTLLESLLDVCRTSVVRDTQMSHGGSDEDEDEDVDDDDRDSDSDTDDGYLSPWSDQSCALSDNDAETDPPREQQKVTLTPSLAPVVTQPISVHTQNDMPVFSRPSTTEETWLLFDFEEHSYICRQCKSPYQRGQKHASLCHKGRYLAERVVEAIDIRDGEVFEKHLTRLRKPHQVEISHTHMREYARVLEELAALRDTRQPKKEQRPRVKVPDSSTDHNDEAYRSSSTEVVIEGGYRNDHRRKDRYRQEEPCESKYYNHDTEHDRHEEREARERRRAAEVEAEIDIRETSHCILKRSDSTLSECMRQVESLLGQLVRFGFEIRQSISTERSRIVDATPNIKERANIRQELIGKLLASKGKTSVSTHKAVLLPNDRNADGLSRVQTRLIDSMLRCQINIDHAWVQTGNLRSRVLPITQAGGASRSTSLSTRHGEDRSGIAGSSEQSLQGPQEEQRMDMISEVLTEWFDEHWESPYPTPAEKATLQKATGLDAPHLDTWLETHRSKNLGSNLKRKNIDWSRRELGRRDGSVPMVQSTASSVPGQSSTKAAFEPGIVQASTASGHIHYSESLKVAQYGKPGSQCPFCVQTFARAFGEDSRRRKHLDEHLLPYICPIEDCGVADIRYSSAEEWKSHLYKDHTWYAYWQCPACSEKIDTSLAFMLHVGQNHNHIVDSDLLDEFAESCKHLELIPFSCPVCEEGDDCTLDAIAEHIHAFFLLCLPWPLAIPSPDELERSEGSDAPRTFFVQDPNGDEIVDVTRTYEYLTNVMRLSEINQWLSATDPIENIHLGTDSSYSSTDTKPSQKTPSDKKPSDTEPLDKKPSLDKPSLAYRQLLLGAKRNTLFHGGPGVGKTRLCSGLVHHLTSDPGVVTIFFCFVRGDSKRQTADGMLRSLISQLYHKRMDCRTPLLKEYYESGDLNLTSMSVLLTQMVQSCALEVHIILDALEKCDD